MRIVGLLLFLAGAVAAGASLSGSLSRRGAAAAALALAAPLAVLIALTGALLLFVPGFFG